MRAGSGRTDHPRTAPPGAGPHGEPMIEARTHDPAAPQPSSPSSPPAPPLHSHVRLLGPEGLSHREDAPEGTKAGRDSTGDDEIDGTALADVSFAPTHVQAAPLRFFPAPSPDPCALVRASAAGPTASPVLAGPLAAGALPPADPMPADPVPADPMLADTMLADLLAWRQRAEQAEHLAALAKAQALEQERLIEAYELREQVVIQDMPYQLGALLIRSFRSPVGLWRLPSGLLALRRKARRAKAAPARASVPMLRPAKGLSHASKAPETVLLPAPPITRARQRALEQARAEEEARAKAEALAESQALARAQAEVEAAAQAVARAAAQAAAQAEARANAQAQAEARAEAMARAKILTEQARTLLPDDPAGAAQAAMAAHAADPRPWRAKWLAFRLYDIGQLRQPAALLAGLPADLALSPSEDLRVRQIEAQARLLDQGLSLPEPARKPAYEPRPRSLLYCAASALPWHTSGYTTRTQALLQALAAHGAGEGTEQAITLTALTRAGYPWDRSDSTGTPEDISSHHDGIDWHHVRHPSQSMPLDLYVARAAIGIARRARSAQVAVIHAASNHVNALPALVAARRLGIPFHYEMRGLWELSRAANVAGFDQSERFALGLALEAQVAHAADHLHVISRPLADHVIARWGIDPARVTILPNGIDAARFAAIAPPRAAAFTLGYAGALVGYEGLDLLLDALALLRAQDRTIALTIIGDGPLREALEQQALRLGLAGQVHFAGRLAPDEARARLAACHATALPRRASPVTELVPPIKLVEAMALGVVPVVPDLPVFRAEATDGETALFFRADDAASLAQAIARLHDDGALTRRLGETARAHALGTRDWAQQAAAIAAHLPVPPEPLPEATAAEDGTAPEPEPEPEPEVVPFPACLPDKPALIAAVADQGAAPALAALDAVDWDDDAGRAGGALRLAALLAEADLHEAGAVLAEEALSRDRSPATLLRAYAAFQRAGQFARCDDLLAELDHHPARHTDKALPARIERLRQGYAGQLDMLRLIGPRRARVMPPVPGRLCYVLHNSLPWTSGGYATRSHGLARGLQDAGCEVIVLSRPGYPCDVLPAAGTESLPEEDVIEGICYLRTPRPSRAKMRYARYVPAAAAALEARFRALRPAVVVAASNHVVALPALIAARRLGIPFAYEVRGFWEVTRMSRNEAYARTAAYKVQELLETAIARQADQVFTLTAPMREELAGRGVPPERIALLPNSCDPARFHPARLDPAGSTLPPHPLFPQGVPVIGYVGTFVDYEGLEDLALACARLRREGREFRLLLVGSENTSGQDARPEAKTDATPGAQPADQPDTQPIPPADETDSLEGTPENGPDNLAETAPDEAVPLGPISQAIAAIAQDGGFADWLIMPGRVPHEEVENWYARIDICPFPRKPWPVCEMVSPMKPLEALAMEKAVVVPDVRALAEMITHEATGLVYAKGDVESLAAALARLLDDKALRQTLGRQGREWVVAERTWARTGATACALLAPFLAQSLPQSPATTSCPQEDAA